MEKGTILKLVHDKEYGTVRTNTGEEAHFHKNCLWNIQFTELTEGQGVEFEIQPSTKGRLAFHIRPCIEILNKGV